jgi:hypothetical protein
MQLVSITPKAVSDLRSHARPGRYPHDVDGVADHVGRSLLARRSLGHGPSIAEIEARFSRQLPVNVTLMAIEMR